MKEFFQNLDRSKLQSITLIAAFILFLLFLTTGIFSGISYAKSKQTINNVKTIVKALEFYNKDQGAYPSAEQFENQEILVPYYLEQMPKQITQSGPCSNFGDFKYTQTEQKNYVLQFCLSKGTAGLSKGIHVKTEKGYR